MKFKVFHGNFDEIQEWCLDNNIEALFLICFSELGIYLTPDEYLEQKKISPTRYTGHARYVSIEISDEAELLFLIRWFDRVMDFGRRWTKEGIG